jgi:uncharacterized membrane protein
MGIGGEDEDWERKTMMACQMGAAMGGMWLFGLGSFAVAILAILLGVWAAAQLLRRSTADARKTLEARFVRGEIDGAEFEQRRKILEGSS